MKYRGTIINLLWSVVWLVNSVTHTTICENLQNINKRTGEAIAADDLIQKYEQEHQTFYIEETNDDTILEWPYLDNKNLSDYCRKYLWNSVPKRTTVNVIGTIIVKALHYKKDNTIITSKIVVVQCNVKVNHIKTKSYYITRAKKQNCVYALLSARYERIRNRLSIINKYCDFENKPYNPLKRKKVEIFDRLHQSTGQPIAKEKFLLEYELEHYDLLKQEGQEVECLGWPHAILHTNLDSYCCQYMRECAPRRNRDGMTGNWKMEKLRYQKFNSCKEIDITIVSCVTAKASNLHYKMTRAPETNCVYALLRTGCGSRDPFKIIFKHCDFEKVYVRENISQDNDIFHVGVIPKPEIKEEMLDTLETYNFH